MSIQLNILLVEDDLDVNEYLTEEFEDAGHTVTSAFNGREALTHLERAFFDVVVTDQMMPMLDGLSMVKEMKARGKLIPVVMVTGAELSNLLDEAKSLGILSVIPKPPSFDSLHNDVIKFAGSKDKQHEHSLKAS